MPRIFITGNAGSGKTTLSHELAQYYDIQPISLDQFVWLSGWQRASADFVKDRVNSVVRQKHWIIDGVSSLCMQHADIIIFLDCPRYLAFYRAFKRNLPYLFRSRPGLPENCPEIMIIPTLVKIIWQFPHTVRPKIISFLQDHDSQKEIYHVQSRKALRDLVNRLKVSKKYD